jgi:hypothetical protein
MFFWIAGIVLAFCLFKCIYWSLKASEPVSPQPTNQSESFMETLFKIIGGLFVAIFTALVASLSLLIMLPLAAIDGWIMHLSWGWFVVPTFGLPQLAWAVSTGLVLLISWATFQLPVGETKQTNTARLASGLGISLLSWFMMWCVHMWIIH